MRKIVPIVEGHGDLAAVPVLLRRILAAHHHYDVEILRPHIRGDLPKITARFDEYFKMAIKENAAVLVLVDFDCQDCDCVVRYANILYQKAQNVRADWPLKVAFMVKEFEALFLADPDATRRVFDKIPATTAFPAEPEKTRGAKEWLSKAQPSGSSYKETVHQVKLSNAVNLDKLRADSPSFRHLEKAVLALLD